MARTGVLEQQEVVLRQHTPRQDVQGLRGLAVLLVVVYHAGLPFPGGFVGVDVFFVISGFVITALLMRELHATGSIKFSRFYARRIRRLLPALALVVGVTLVASFLLGSPFDNQQTVTALTGIGAMLMSANFVIFLNSGGYFATPPTNNPLLNTWSLSVEEQFYLVFPAIVLGLWLVARRSRRWQNNRVLVTGLGVLALASFLLGLGMTYGVINYRLSDPDWFAFYSSPTRAWEFAIGALAYLIFGAGRAGVNRYLGAPLVILGLAGIGASAFVISGNSAFPGYVAALPVLSTALVLIGGSISPNPFSQLIAVRPLARLGDVSYSWYLWHWPAIAFAVMLISDSVLVKVAASLVALALAFATLRFVENPLRFGTRFQGRRVVLLATACVVPVLVIATALYVGARANWGSPSLQTMAAQVSAQHLWQSEDCNTDEPLGQRGPECVWNASASGAPVYLVGDSMAGMLSEAVLGAGEELDRPVWAGTRGACPFIDANMIIAGKADSACSDFVHGSVEWLLQQPPATVIMSSTIGYTAMGDVELVPTMAPEGSVDVQNKEQIYVSAVGSMVRQLTAAGHEVIVVMPTPGFPKTVNASWFWYPSNCATYEALIDTPGCGLTRELHDVIDETAVIDGQLAAEIVASGGEPLQLRDALCRDDTCATNFGNEWLYLDGTHISVRGSESLAPFMATVLR